jgi:hypothetical protein
MTDYLQETLEYLGESEGDVLAHGLSEDGLEYVVVLDKGIKGCPKYRIPLDVLLNRPEEAAVVENLEPVDDPEPVVEPETELETPEPAAEPEWAELVVDAEAAEFSEYPLDSLSYRQLQELAKDTGIPANQNKAELIAALQEQENV